MDERQAGGFAAIIDRTSRLLALAGGALLVAAAAMVVVSVTLRSDLVGAAGVPGDFELVQMATAVCAFCFLPFCQWRRSNIFVDTFTLKLPQRWQRGIDATWDALYGLVMVVICWRLAVGAAGALASHERSMVLGLPLYLPVGLCALLAAAVAVTAFGSAAVLVRGRR